MVQRDLGLDLTDIFKTQLWDTDKYSKREVSREVICAVQMACNMGTFECRFF